MVGYGGPIFKKNYRFSVCFAPIAVKIGKNEKARKSFVYADCGLLKAKPAVGFEPTT